MKKKSKYTKLLKLSIVLLLLQIILLMLSLSTYSQVGDCPTQYICASGNFTLAVDVTDELDVTNNGCLAVNEGNTSYWFRICTSTAGTIQFTINPSGNVDYDWACWLGSNCPPTTIPIRCSFAVPFVGVNGDQTGCNSVNNAPFTDNSEGAFGNNWTQDINAPVGQCYIICVNRYSTTGSDNFSFTLGGTATYNCLPLPISLITFEGFYENQVVTLDWSTASEINNSHFIIEKMGDDFGIKEIGRVEGSGNSNTMKQYGFIDLHPSEGINYYRIIQYDYNGDFETYNWISVLVSEDGDKCCKEYYNLLGEPVEFEAVPNGLYIGITSNNNVIKVRK